MFLNHVMIMNKTMKDGERFEDQLEKLEKIVSRLEDESVGLEEALGLFEGGMELARSCRARLEEVEARVTQLLEEDDHDVTTEDEESERRQGEFNANTQMFVDALNVDEIVGQGLASEGFSDVEEVACVHEL